jgi:hypothetical protein
MNNELEYGAVFVFQGRHKGRVLYYDDDGAPRTAICYVGHPIDFVGTHNIPIRFLRVPTIDDLLKRHEEIGRQLAKFAIDDEWDISPDNIHSLWSEKSLINDILYERRMFGKFTQLSERSVIFLCHSSSDKGAVRMVHDDLHGMVPSGQNVPARLGPPRNVVRAELLLMEQVKCRRVVRGPDELLIFRGEVAGKELGAVRQHPGAPIGDLDAREYVRWEFVELVLHGLAGIWGNRRDVDEAHDAFVDARGSDGGAAIRMAHKKDRIADTIERALHGRHIVFE